MKSFTRLVAVLTGLGALAGWDRLSTAAAAQTPTATLTQDALVGSWVRVLATSKEKWKADSALAYQNGESAWWEGPAEWAGRQVAYYLTLNADGTSQAHIEVDGVRDSTLGGGWVIYMGEEVRDRGQWALRGDTLKAGVDGRYVRYQVAREGTTLVLRTAWYRDLDRTRHWQCTRIFTRVEAGKPLPGPSAKDGCQTVAGALPLVPLPKATELVGTWARVDSSRWGADTGKGSPHICGGPGRCRLVRYDTLVFQADSVLLHKVIEVYPAQPNGEVSPIVVPEVRWWIAADTLWTEREMTANGKPIKFVYANGKRVPAQPIKNATVEIRLEDDGRYLMLEQRVYRRVRPTAP